MVPLTAIDADGASVSAHKHECQDIRITSASGSRPCLHHPLPLQKRHINDASILPPFCMTTDLHTAYHLNHHAGHIASSIPISFVPSTVCLRQPQVRQHIVDRTRRELVRNHFTDAGASRVEVL